MTDHEYQKDLSHTTWDEVYARQMKRADLVGEWLDAVQLGEGQRLLDVGSGPGYVSLLAARRVGATGIVYAVDRSADALAFLERLQREQEITQIRRIAADAATLDPGEIQADAALVTMVLHHTDDPIKVLSAVSRVLVTGGLALIGEFHPDGPGQFGPPPAHRVGPDVVRAWAEQSGFEVVDERRQTPEHYFLLVRKKDGLSGSNGETRVRPVASKAHHHPAGHAGIRESPPEGNVTIISRKSYRQALYSSGQTLYYPAMFLTWGERKMPCP